ncbi:hypothetical protein JCM15765_28360 [Paradesulfitobacterium aromaticivorans]
MIEKKAGEQTLEELVEALKALREKEKLQDNLVHKFRSLIMDQGLSSQIIKGFPHPMAFFLQNGDLVLVNSAFSKETGLYPAELTKSKHNMLNRITDANFRILDAVENVFRGEITSLTGLSDPLGMFISESSNKRRSFINCKCAIFFPVIEVEGQVTQGAVIFIE